MLEQPRYIFISEVTTYNTCCCYKSVAFFPLFVGKDILKSFVVVKMNPSHSVHTRPSILFGPCLKVT